MENREYVILTDSTCDMDNHYYTVNNVEVIGLHYTIDHQNYIQCSNKDMDTKSFYDRVRRGSMPETTPLTYEEATNALEKFAKEGTDVFFLTFSGGLSSSYQNVQIAAEDLMSKYPEWSIKVVDSLSATCGQGLLLHLCIKKRNAGASIDELVKYAERMRSHVVHLFTVDDLNHLHRGGRLSKMSAIMGSILHVKPMLYVDDNGKLGTYAKAKGRKKALEMLAENMKATYLPEENEEIFISHSDSAEDAEYLGSVIIKLMPDVKRIRYLKLGPVIGAHAGADTVVVAFIGKNRLPVE